MKMKRACEATGLTERAIRLYLSKGLISPGQTNGLLDFSPVDIQHLHDIAVLRRYDFTIEQIANMIHHAGMIGDILSIRLAEAKSDMQHEYEVCQVLGGLTGTPLGSLHDVAERIRQQCAEPPTPDFGRCDEITDEERQQQRLVALQSLSRQEKTAQWRGRLIAAACAVLVLVAAAVVYLMRMRVSGYISVSPVTVEAVYPNWQGTFRIGSEQAAETLGREVITVAFRNAANPLEPLKPGMQFDHACQLTVQLRNLDLLLMGINPLQTMQTRSEDINDEWMRYVLQTLFARERVERARLVIRGYTGMKPLLHGE